MLIPLIDNTSGQTLPPSDSPDKDQYKPELSIVIPVKDEEDNVFLLARRVGMVFAEHPSVRWECIWVDDGSTDRTLERIKKVAEVDSHHRLVVLTQNCGQSAALRAGFSACRGDYIATLDGDLQNDPQDLPRLLAELKVKQVDMVTGFRARRQDNLIRIISSRVANFVRNRFTKETIKDVGCSVRVMRHDCVRNLPAVRGMHRFLPTLVKMEGYRVEQLPVSHHSRRHGITKYGIGNRLWVGIGDLLWVRWYQKRYVQAVALEYVTAEEEVGVVHG